MDVSEEEIVHSGLATRRGTGSSGLRRSIDSALELTRRISAVPLEWRFLAFSVVVLVAGAYVIGSWTTGEIEDRVLQHSASTNALYVDSFVHPYLQPLDTSGGLEPQHIAALSGLLSETALGETVVSFKVWAPDGEILYATDERLIGQSFPPEDALKRAANGIVSAHVTNLDAEENRYEREQWDKLIETYAPVRSDETGELIAVAEFYQLPDDILGEIRSSQNQGWLIVGVATFVMFLVLNGMVRQASSTIRRQNEGMRRLNEQVRAASASNVQREEQVMTRLAQDLHDVPAQNLATALLRMDRLDGSVPAGQRQNWEMIKQSVDTALADLRGISGGIRIPDLEELDAAAVISKAVADFEGRTGHHVSVTTAAASAPLAAAAKVAVYRVVQEALNNAATHGNASSMEVTASVRPNTLVVEIADDGSGFSQSDIAGERRAGERPRLGIRGMRERAELLGGSFQIASRPGGGTTVVASIPLSRRGQL